MRPTLPPSRVRFLVLAAAVAVALSACGRRGDLEPPVAAGAPTPAASGEPAFHRAVPKITPPKQSFALDPLLQ